MAGSLTARGHGHPGTRWARSRSHVPGCWVFRHLGVQLDARCQKHGSWVSWEWGGVRCVPGVSGAQGRWGTHWGGSDNGHERGCFVRGSKWPLRKAASGDGILDTSWDWSQVNLRATGAPSGSGYVVGFVVPLVADETA